MPKKPVHQAIRWMRIKLDQKITYERKKYNCTCEINADHCDLKPK